MADVFEYFLHPEKLPQIPPPHEILELADGQEIVFTVQDYMVGRMTIEPRWPGAPKEKTIVAIRVFVPPEEKPVGPPYWDITPSTLVFQLLSILPNIEKGRTKIRIKAFGERPRKRFMVEVIPPS